MVDLSGDNAGILAQFDREIPELKSEYQLLDAQAKMAFREWLEQLTSVVEALPTEIKITTLCRVNRMETDDEGEIVYDGVVFLEPKSMLAAVTAWDAGEGFTPESFNQIM